MWSAGYDGGGFDTSAQFSSPVQDKKQPTRAHILVPVTVRQILESTEEGLKIGDTEIQKPMIKVIGIVKSVDISTVTVTYTIEDDTGTVNGLYWLDADGGASESNIPVVENTYCAMFGTIRTQGEGKHVMVFQIYPITNLNEITAHRLQVIHYFLKAEQGMDQDPQPGSIKQEMASSYQNERFSNHFGLNPGQYKVYKAISECPSETGATLQYIANAMTTKMPNNEISKIIEFLVNEGHVYSSIDDYHFKSTENA